MKNGEVSPLGLFGFPGVREGDMIFVPIGHIEAIEPPREGPTSGARSCVVLKTGRFYECCESPQDVAMTLQSFVEGKVRVESFTYAEMNEAGLRD